MDLVDSNCCDSFGRTDTIAARCPKRGSRTMPSEEGSRCNRSVTIVALALPYDPKRQANVTWQAESNARLLPGMRMLQGVNGLNHTEVIGELIASGLRFHDLSRAARKWGVLACLLTHYKALMYQVQHRLPFMVTLEDDVRARPAFQALIGAACTHLERWSEQNQRVPDLIQLSRFLEVKLTPLSGAERLLQLIHERGIRKSADQQFADTKTMGTRHDVVKHLRHLAWKQRPWTLVRLPNSADGTIWKSRPMTWTEMALLRLLTNPAAGSLPNFGNPVLAPGTPRTWAK